MVQFHLVCGHWPFLSIYKWVQTLTCMEAFQTELQRLSTSWTCTIAQSVELYFHILTFFLASAISTYIKTECQPLSGSIESQIFNSTPATNEQVPVQAMSLLNLGSNFFTGNIPTTLALLNATLSFLDLPANRFDGIIPPELGKLKIISALLLNDDQLTGPVPPTLGEMRRLNSCLLQGNRLQGTIPRQLLKPRHLRLLFLHSNEFTGEVPSFAQAHSLTSLTIFGNSVQGQLKLSPRSAMDALYAFGNRLSCGVVADELTISKKANLVLPGNTISEPLEDWLQMREVSFLSSAADFWMGWRSLIFEVSIGTSISV